MLTVMLWIIGVYIALSYAWGGYVAWRLYKIRKLMNGTSTVEFGQLEDNEVVEGRVCLEGDCAQDTGELWGQGGCKEEKREEQGERECEEDENEAA